MFVNEKICIKINDYELDNCIVELIRKETLHHDIDQIRFMGNCTLYYINDVNGFYIIEKARRDYREWIRKCAGYLYEMTGTRNENLLGELIEAIKTILENEKKNLLIKEKIIEESFSKYAHIRFMSICTLRCLNLDENNKTLMDLSSVGGGDSSKWVRNFAKSLYEKITEKDGNKDCIER